MNTGSASCAACPGGKSTSSAGQESCLECPGGTYTDGSGSSECISCGNMYTSNAGSDSRSACAMKGGFIALFFFVALTGLICCCCCGFGCIKLTQYIREKKNEARNNADRSYRDAIGFLNTVIQDRANQVETMEQATRFKDGLRMWNGAKSSCWGTNLNAAFFDDAEEVTSLARLIVEAWDDPDAVTVVVRFMGGSQDDKNLRFRRNVPVGMLRKMIFSAGVFPPGTKADQLDVIFGGDHLPLNCTLYDNEVESGAEIRVKVGTKQAFQTMDIDAPPPPPYGEAPPPPPPPDKMF